MTNISLKRIYEPASDNDGVRILVDRLWPRGISKQKARIDCWAKDIAPSSELRKMFHKQDCSEMQFRQFYYNELKSHTESLESLKAFMQQHKQVTLLYSSRSEPFNNASVLAEYLRERCGL